MVARWIKRLAAVAVLAAILAATIWALAPAPVGVDLVTVDRGPLDVTIDEEGIARIRDIFRVSAPLAGRLERSPVHIGDRVHRGATEVASIRPADPPFLDARTRREMEAGADAGRAAVRLAAAQIHAAETGERLALAAFDRAERLAALGTISEQAFEKAAADLDAAKARIEEANANLALRQSELASLEARLIEPDQPAAGAGRNSCCKSVLAPVDGVVLSVLAESETVVAAGTPLVEIGDPAGMEIVVHLLSSDAVTIAPGTPATVTDWGGPDALQARVSRIDPAAYTKVSALGIEEQRVDATLDIVTPYEQWQGLGHAFRVMVHISTWQGADVLQVPLGALFRQDSDWTVYRVVDGRAAATAIVLGHRNNVAAEVLDGLSQGDTVVLHPSDRVVDGAAVGPRDGGG